MNQLCCVLNTWVKCSECDWVACRQCGCTTVAAWDIHCEEAPDCELSKGTRWDITNRPEDDVHCIARRGDYGS